MPFVSLKDTQSAISLYTERSEILPPSLPASLLSSHTTKQADNLVFVLRAIDIAGAFQA